jgi:hypothetical protein
MHRSLYLLALIILLAACAQPDAQPTPPPAAVEAEPPVLEPSPAPLFVGIPPRPTTVEIDPTSTPAPTPTPAPIGDCPARFEQLDSIDRALFESVTSINDVFIDRRFMIWDGRYRFEDMPMLLARRDRAGAPPRYGFLFNWSSGLLENGGAFKTPSFLDLGTVYCVSPLARAQDLIGVPALLRQPTHEADLPITITTPDGRQTDDDSVFLLIYGDRSKESRLADRAADPRATERWTSYAVRAVFGRWQAVEGPLDQQFRLAAPEGGAAQPPTPEQMALALLEQRILAAALRANGADEQLARQLIAVRQLRLPQAAGALAEQAQEQRDGTAEYVAYRFAAAAGQSQLQSWPERLLAGYAAERAPAPGSGASPIGDYMRDERPALVGAAIGGLLDVSAIPWRGQMAQGKTPFEILAAAFPLADGEPEALAAQAKAAFGYDELAARVEAARR